MAEQTTRRRSKRLAGDRPLHKAMQGHAAITSLLGGGSGAFEHGKEFLGLDDTVKWGQESVKVASKRKRDTGEESDDDYLDGGVVGYHHEKSQTRTLKRRARPDYEYSEETTTRFSKTTKFYKDPTISAFGSFLTLKVPGLARKAKESDAAPELVEQVEAVEAVAPVELAEAIAPAEHVEAVEAIAPVELAQAVAPAEHAEAVEAVAPFEPVEAVASVESAEAVTPAEPATSVESAVVEPAELAEPVAGTEPAPPEEELVYDWKADDADEEEVDATDEKPVPRRKLAKPPAQGHLSPKYRVSFNWTPYDWHHGPTPEQCQIVFEILTQWTLAKNGYDINVEIDRIAMKPLHGARGGTVHPIVNVIMSQATKNENAIVVQKQLTKDFPYIVNGEKVVTNTPNYHEIMKLKPSELANHIRAAGFGNQRAVHILGFLNSVREENEKLLRVNGKLPDNIETGNPPDAPDFVPGLLSLDFLNGKSKEEIFQWLVSMEGVGVKSAICVLEFDFGYPLCAVDTHVFNMTSWLGWLPAECKDDNKAFCHLDAHIPEHLKHALHQLFWQHMQLCIPCKRKHDKNTPLPAGAEPCPLEAVGINRKVNRKKSAWKPKRDEQGKIIKTEIFQKSVKITKFKNADLAAAKGYIKEIINIHDDFDVTGTNDVNMKSTNVKKEERWEYVGVEEAMRANGQSSVKKFFTTIKPEGL
ncbi:hypothetical protein DV735_g3304, partial [Chaetothyriales sp. CBS 134920]